MPSPSGQLIKVVIRESRWLEPDTSDPLILPDSILPGHQAVIPGTLRALIRHETVPRGSGKALVDDEVVSLLGYSERLRRSIPEFSGGSSIVIQYPLQLSLPSYIDCMTKVEEMTISWTVRVFLYLCFPTLLNANQVHNISNKPYGSASELRRETKTKLIDRGRQFVLDSAAEGANFMEDALENVIPSAGNTLSESLEVARETRIFSTGNLILELYLSDPHSGELRKIMHHNFTIQISEAYEFKPNSQFLLIINASTNDDAVIRMKNFIKSELQLGVDVYNVSLKGTLIDEESRKSVMLKYRRKSIIISGNSFTFFSKHTRYNWELMDPHDVLSLSMDDTSFLFCSVLSSRATDSLKQWLSLLRYPFGLDLTTTESIIEHKSRYTLLESLRKGSSSEQPTLELSYQYTLSNKFRILRRKMEKRLNSHRNAVVRELNTQTPTRRFIVVSEKYYPIIEESLEVEKPPGLPESVEFKEEEKSPQTLVEKKIPKKVKSEGTITVAEGLSRTANCIVSLSGILDSHGTITAQQAVMMTATLPTQMLATIFWNIVRSVNSQGINAEAFYRNLPVVHSDPELTTIDDYENENLDGKPISYQVGFLLKTFSNRIDLTFSRHARLSLGQWNMLLTRTSSNCAKITISLTR
jgi:hypothetical protein